MDSGMEQAGESGKEGSMNRHCASCGNAIKGLSFKRIQNGVEWVLCHDCTFRFDGAAKCPDKVEPESHRASHSGKKRLILHLTCVRPGDRKEFDRIQHVEIDVTDTAIALPIFYMRDGIPPAVTNAHFEELEEKA
jgi:ribosomal protein L37AE/L43A